MEAQFPLPPNLQQQKSLDLLQLHDIQCLYAQAQNPCFVPPQNRPPPQPYNQLNLPANGGGIRQLYNHAQSAMQNIPAQQPPFNVGQHSTSFVPPQPYNYALRNPYNVPPPHGQFRAQIMAYMPPQYGQMQPPYFHMPQCVNFIPLPCGQVHPPDAPIFNPLNVSGPADKLPGYNVPLANNQSKKHTYVNGTPYNTELLESPGEPEFPAQFFWPDMDFAEDDIADEGYDPLDYAMPTDYGIRFYNPNNGPEGAIPKRFKNNKFNCNANAKNAEPSPKPKPESLLPDIPLYEGIYGQRVNNIGHDVMACNKTSQQDAVQGLAEAANTAAQNSKAKCGQGRGRSRGFIQSFGIVAPIKHYNQTAKENVAAAKNVLSLFERPRIKNGMI